MTGHFLIILAQQLQTYFNRFGYAGIYFWFVTVDQIAPIPEEITLIAIGYAASSGLINPFLAGACSVLAFMTIDTIYYYLTKTGNKFITKITKKAKSPAVENYKKKLKENMPKALFVISFIPRVRLLAPVFVALSNLPFPRFLLFSSLSLSLFTAIYIALGFVFHKSFGSLLTKIPVVGNVIFFVAMGVIMVIVSIIIARKLKKKKKS